jgi:hypothetical protein
MTQTKKKPSTKATQDKPKEELKIGKVKNPNEQNVKKIFNSGLSGAIGGDQIKAVVAKRVAVKKTAQTTKAKIVKEVVKKIKEDSPLSMKARLDDAVVKKLKASTAKPKDQPEVESISTPPLVKAEKFVMTGQGEQVKKTQKTNEEMWEQFRKEFGR